MKDWQQRRTGESVAGPSFFSVWSQPRHNRGAEELIELVLIGVYALSVVSIVVLLGVGVVGAAVGWW